MTHFPTPLFLAYFLGFVEIWKRYIYSILASLRIQLEQAQCINRLVSSITDATQIWIGVFLVFILLFLLGALIKYRLKTRNTVRLLIYNTNESLPLSKRKVKHADICVCPEALWAESKIFFLHKNGYYSFETMFDDTCSHSALRKAMTTIPTTLFELYVFPVFNMLRLASYRPINVMERPVFFSQLSEAGFIYSGEEHIVGCEACKKRIDLTTVETHPSNARYHNPRCRYIVHETNPETENMHNGISSPVGASNTAVSSSPLENASITISSEINARQGLRSSDQLTVESSENRYFPVGISSTLETPTAASGPVRSIEGTSPLRKQSQTQTDLDENSVGLSSSSNIDLSVISDYRVTGSPDIQHENRQDTTDTTTGFTQPVHPFYSTPQSRLESFGTWKSSHVGLQHPLAEGGFFYAGLTYCVSCFQCGLALKPWEVGDDVNKEHKRLKPSCPFLLSPLSRRSHDDCLRCFQCGSKWRFEIGDDGYSNHERINPNCPCLQSQQSSRNGPTVSGNTQENSSHYGATTSANTQPENPQTTRTDSSQPVCGSFSSLQSRVDSFHSWGYSQVVDTHRLAAAGIYYTGHGDYLRCFQCGSIWRYKIGDDGYSNHERMNSNCSCLQSQQSSRNGSTVSGNTQGDFSQREQRRQSFTNWQGLHPLDPEELCEFYYLTGPGYRMKCFMCHCSVYIHGNENLEHSAQDLNEGRPIGCLCAERLSRLSFSLCAIIDEEQGTA